MQAKPARQTERGESLVQAGGKSQTNYAQNPKLHDYIMSQVRKTNKIRKTNQKNEGE